MDYILNKFLPRIKFDSYEDFKANFKINVPEDFNFGYDVVDVLAEMGFENIGCVEDDKERIYVLQNTAFRANGVGIATAIDVIQKNGLPTYKPCRIVVLDNNVPQLSLYYQPIIGDSVPEAKREDWKVSYELGSSWNKVRKEIELENSSLFKVDVLVYPGLSLKNLIITQIYQVLFRLSPAVEVSLWKGMKLTAQLRIPVYNDGYGTLNDKVSPGFLTVSQSFRLPYNVFGRFTVGGFNFDRYGVDLNLKYPANWERAREIKFSQGFTLPGPRDFVGTAPLTEPEARAVYNFTRNHDFKLTLSYHSQGEIIYWKYLDYEPENSRRIAEYFGEVSGYSVEETPYASGFAGYKDWFIETYNRPGYTIEIGIGMSPLPLSQFPKIYNDNIGILVGGITQI